MVYVYVCKRFRVLMDLVGSKDIEWVNSVLTSYAHHTRIQAKLERAEINVKKRTCTTKYDSSTDMFKINIVYKDTRGCEHELKWIIKITRSDLNQVSEFLLRQEQQVYSRLVTDLINTIKQKASGRLEGSRLSINDLLIMPMFIYEEISGTALGENANRTVLVLENLEEKGYTKYSQIHSHPLNLCHLKSVVQTLAKFHAVGLVYKHKMFANFSTHLAQLKASRSLDEIVMEGEGEVPIGSKGLFARFPFLDMHTTAIGHLSQNRSNLFSMYKMFLSMFHDGQHLISIFECLETFFDEICIEPAQNFTIPSQQPTTQDQQGDGDHFSSSSLTPPPSPRLKNIPRQDSTVSNSSSGVTNLVALDEKYNHPLDSICLGMIENRSFLFHYNDSDDDEEYDDFKENTSTNNRIFGQQRKSRGCVKLQRSQSERVTERPPRILIRTHPPQSPLCSKPKNTVTLNAEVCEDNLNAFPPPPTASSHTEQVLPTSSDPQTLGVKPKPPTRTNVLNPATKSSVNKGDPPGRLKIQNKFLSSVSGVSRGQTKDDVNIAITARKATRSPKQRAENAVPKRVALVNAKYVTFGRITRDLSVLIWTSGSSLARRFYLIKLFSIYAEKLGITLDQLGFDTESIGLEYVDILQDFQSSIPYGFLLSVLLNMAATSKDELTQLYNENLKSQKSKKKGADTEETKSESHDGFLALTESRVEYLIDLMRDMAVFVTSQDFAENIPMTNFNRYHELWESNNRGGLPSRRNENDESGSDDEDCYYDEEESEMEEN